MYHKYMIFLIWMYQYCINELNISHSGSKPKIVSINKYDKLNEHKLNFIKSRMYIIKDEYSKQTLIYSRRHICSTWLLYNLVSNHLAMGSTSISSIFIYPIVTSQFLIWYLTTKYLYQYICYYSHSYYSFKEYCSWIIATYFQWPFYRSNKF